MTQELYSLRILGIPSLMFPLIITGADLPRGLLGHEHSHPSSTLGEACAPCWGMRTGSPAPASMASFAPVASLQRWVPNWSGYFAGQTSAAGNCLASLAWSWFPSRTDPMPCANKGVQGWLDTENMCGKLYLKTGRHNYSENNSAVHSVC